MAGKRYEREKHEAQVGMEGFMTMLGQFNQTIQGLVQHGQQLPPARNNAAFMVEAFMR